MSDLSLKGGSFTPLFSFNSIIDTDLGVLNYIFKEFRNEKYFNLDVLDYMELINKVYYRSVQNPLYIIMKNPDSEEDKQFLDECYEELITTKEREILSYSLSTQILELISIYRKEAGIQPTVFYYTDAQLEYIDRTIEFDSINTISANDITGILKLNYQQIYLKYIEEMYLFAKFNGRSLYVSSCGLNLNEKHDDMREDDIINHMIMSQNQINIIDLYRTDIIGKDIYKYG